MFPLFLKVCVRMKFFVCNILPGLICNWNDVYEICEKHFWKEHLCALKVFLCALVSQPMCARTRAQLRGNIARPSDMFSGNVVVQVDLPVYVATRMAPRSIAPRMCCRTSSPCRALCCRAI